MARTPPTTMPSTAELVAAGLRAGLDAVGVCTAAEFPEVRETLEARKAQGLHGGMAFTYRNPARSTDPSAALPHARALVVGARSYHRDEPAPPSTAGPYARIASYAWQDHYGALKDALGSVADLLRTDGWRTRVLVDDNALVDRAAAVRAGIAWWGKSANVLVPGRGSWFVLGAVVTDAPLVDRDPDPVPDGCGTCRRCLDGCPTGAIVEPGVVDARRCLSWLLQAAGVFPREHRVALGDRLYGCDECQDVCPPNRREQRTRVALPRRADEAADEAWVPVLEVLRCSDDEILRRYGRWYIPKREPRWVRRNALVVLGNVGDGRDPAVVAALRDALADPDPVLRAHAVWAAARLGRHDLLDAVRDDHDPMVSSELAAVGAA